MILIGFLFYRSRGVVVRPGFRTGNRTIKRGSQVSFSVSVVESSNLCILAIIFIGSYLALIVVWYWCLSSHHDKSQIGTNKDDAKDAKV